MVFECINIREILGRCWKPRPAASVFNTSHGTLRMLMHEKNMFDPYIDTPYVNYYIQKSLVRLLSRLNTETVTLRMALAQMIYITDR